MSSAASETTSKRTVFDIRGMDCAECARSVATAVERLPGVTNADVNFGAGILTIESDPVSQIDLTPRVLHAVEVAGYRATSRDSARPTGGPSILADRRAQLAVVSVALWLSGALLSVLFDRADIARFVYIASVATGGWTFGRAALQAMRGRRIDMNVLMAVAIVGALLLGDWAEAAAAAALFAVGNLAQSLTFDRTRSALSSLSRLAPAEALSVVNGRESLVPVDRLIPGDRIRVKSGERFPIDGVIVEGSTSVDESMITGESLPSDKSPGARVFAASLNGPGSVLVDVTRSAADSTFANIVALVEEAQGDRGHAEQTIDRFAAIYTPVVVGLAAVMALAGGVVTGDWREWATRGLVLLVIACPCALIISTPVAIVSAVGVAARRGFVVKGGAALESIASIRAVVFDKTGTLTRGRPAVVAVESVEMPERDLIRLAASVEALSEHPLGLAILDRAARDGIDIAPATEFIAIAGRGASAVVEGTRIWIGSPAWFDDLGIATQKVELLERDQPAQTLLLVAQATDGTPIHIGSVALSDRVRKEGRAVVQLLREQSVAPIAMMTGDNSATAKAIADQCGIDLVFAELLPGEKSERVTGLKEEFGKTAMVGDGVNDGPALGAANIGFAMGLTGSDLAVETADVAILRNDLFAVPGAIDLSRRTVSIIRQNIGVSLAVKVVALALTLFGITTLWMAVAVDLGTSLLVTANALRLTRWRLQGSGHAHSGVQSPVESGTGDAPGLATGDA